ncbi:MAG TPA: hypothetical protein VHT75_03905 [Acidimicrobiales bacterium]|jgi:hypothetical protein|nr:hypothetical protein [Acidimicrobiales bacterium]
MILAVLTAILLIVFVLRLARQPGAKVNLGDQEFSVGKDTALAAQISALGRPLLFPPLRGSIVLYVQHLGGDPAKGWLAFNAEVPGHASPCLVTWQVTTRDFADCHGIHYPADGHGLDQYPVRVDASGQVIVNLRQSIGTIPPTDATTTTASATTAPARTTTSPASVTTIAPTTTGG